MNEKHADIRPFTRQFYRNNTLRFAMALVPTLLLTAVNLTISWQIQQLLDLAAGVDTGFTLTQLAVISLLCMAMICLIFLCLTFSRPRFLSRAIGQYKEYAFLQISKKGISAFSRENTGLYVSALSNDAAVIETSYLSNLFSVVSQSVLFAAALVMMFLYDRLLTVLSIVLSLLPMLVSLTAGRRAAAAEKNISDLNERYMSTLRDSLAGFSVIKSFRAELQMCRIFAESIKKVSDAKEKRDKITLLIEMMSSLAGFIVQIGVFLAGTFLALSGRDMTVGTILIFVQLLNFVLGPIGTVPNLLAQRKAAKALIQKLADALTENLREEGTVEKHTLTDGIRLHGLTVSYEPEKPVLQNLSFTFHAGKSYAIVGASGSGKSTLLNTLMASGSGYAGSVLFDGTQLKEMSGESLYEIISVIQQNVFIFNASIRDNITMFSDFSREEVDRVIELSGLSRLIAERGEDYLCGENGCLLSGGEKQRISIARSLLKKSQVLLADEVTAALDAQTAFQIFDMILGLTGMTRIVVTHALDPNLLKRCDCILALKNGVIAESGTFEELMQKRDYFYSLYTVSQ
ncbi:MAG: ABC transporter ATP-binding protein/permease [bacterium]|nr:ABC transporter ATP-binding protein/permease [bacterium]